MAGLGGADSFREWVDMCDRLVEVEDDREKVVLCAVEDDWREALEAREIDWERLMASYEAFLVWDGDRLGMTGASDDMAAATAGEARGAKGLPGAMNRVERWVGSGDELRSPGATSGLVGGVESRVLMVSESLSEDLEAWFAVVTGGREWSRSPERGRSGAL
jgi:hypothetical protein